MVLSLLWLAVTILWVNKAVLLNENCCYGKDVCHGQESYDLCISTDSLCKWSCNNHDNLDENDYDDNYRQLSGLYMFDRYGNEETINFTEEYFNYLNESDIDRRRLIRYEQLNGRSDSPSTSIGQLWIKGWNPMDKGSKLARTLQEYTNYKKKTNPSPKELADWTQHIMDKGFSSHLRIGVITEEEAKIVLNGGQYDKIGHGVATIIKAKEIPDSGGKWEYIAITVAHNCFTNKKNNIDFEFIVPFDDADKRYPDGTKDSLYKKKATLSRDNWERVWIPQYDEYEAFIDQSGKGHQYDWALIQWITNKKVDNIKHAILYNTTAKTKSIDTCSLTYDAHSNYPNKQIALKQTWEKTADGVFLEHDFIKGEDFGHKGKGFSGTGITTGKWINDAKNCDVKEVVAVLNGPHTKPWSISDGDTLKKTLKYVIKKNAKKQEYLAEVDQVVDIAIAGKLVKWDHILQDLLKGDVYKKYFASKKNDKDEKYIWFNAFKMILKKGKKVVHARMFTEKDIKIIDSILKDGDNTIKANYKRINSAHASIYNELNQDEEFEDEEFEAEESMINIFGMIIILSVIIYALICIGFGAVFGYFVGSLSNLSK